MQQTNIPDLGPLLRTDELGRPCWRFNGTQRMDAAAALVLSQRNSTVAIVCRVHRNQTGTALFSLGNSVTPANTGGGLLRVNIDTTSTPPYIAGASKAAYTGAGLGKYCIAGSQLQVIWLSSGAAGQVLGINNTGPEAVAVQSAAVVGATGGQIGAYSQTPGAAGAWLDADIYEIIVWNSALSQATALQNVAALTSNWNIAETKNRLLIEGDSITQGILGSNSNGVLSGDNPGMVISAPGTVFSNGWSVVNQAITGNKVADVVVRRDHANTISTQLLPGRNVLLVQIGRNDAVTTTGADIYWKHATDTGIVPLLNTSVIVTPNSNGFFNRGTTAGIPWEACVAVNIADGSAVPSPNITALRVLLRDLATFKTDTQTGVAATYAGQLRICDLPLQTVGGVTLWNTQANAQDIPTGYYQEGNPGTHPTGASGAISPVLNNGTYYMTVGGDNAANGYLQRAFATS
jgi:hypothetical protein